jgi:hypothetical protein
MDGVHTGGKKKGKFHIGISETNRPLQRLCCRYEDNFNVDPKDIGWERLDAPGSGKGPLTGSCEMNLQVPPNAGN